MKQPGFGTVTIWSRWWQTDQPCTDIVSAMEPFSVGLYELHFTAVIHPFSFAIFGIGGTRNKDAIALLAPVVAAISGVVLACVWLFASSVASLPLYEWKLGRQHCRYAWIFLNANK